MDWSRQWIWLLRKVFSHPFKARITMLDGRANDDFREGISRNTLPYSVRFLSGHPTTLWNTNSWPIRDINVSITCYGHLVEDSFSYVCWHMLVWEYHVLVCKIGSKLKLSNEYAQMRQSNSPDEQILLIFLNQFSCLKNVGLISIAFLSEYRERENLPRW